MTNKVKHGFVSLAVKNATFYIFLILISSTLIGYLLYRITSDIVLSSSQQQLKHNIEILDLKISSYIDHIRKDILYLSRSPYLKDYIRDQSKNAEEKQNKLAKDYISFMSTKPDYAQLRVIGKTNNGQEILRTDRKGDTLHLIQKNQLQSKGEYSYFKEPLEYPEDSVYFSVIDLNKEFGKISKPEMSTLRAACPIYLEDTVFGIIIINANLNAFIRELKTFVPKEFKLYLINQDGYYLLHPDPEKEFGFEKSQKATALDDLGIEIKNNKPTSEIYTSELDDKHLFIYKKISYPRKSYSLILGLQSDRETILSYFYRWQGLIILVTLGIILMTILAALWWMRKQTQSLKSITSAVTSFKQDLRTENLPLQLNDEIGLLANSFKEMADTIKQNITNLAIAKEDAENANQLKEEFLQNMSHEIRNPLQTIIGMCRILNDNTPRPDQIPLIESLQYSSDHLLTLVNDVLDFSKLREGRIHLIQDRLYLSDFLKQIQKSYIYESRSKKIEFELQVENHLKELTLITDPVRLKQILHNLISNAFKFTRENGKIELSVKHLYSDSEMVKLQFEIKDNGIGIKPSQLERIRQRFIQIKDQRDPTINLDGAGLGLPIVIQLLKLFDTELEIESTPEVGSVFSFQLKMKKAETLDKSASFSITTQAEFHFGNVLLMDDDPLVLHLYEHVLGSYSESLRALTQPEQLSDLDQMDKFDLIITDFHFESTSAEKIAALIRQKLNKAGKLVCISGAQFDYPFAQSQKWFDAIWLKPIKPEKLLENLNSLYRKRPHASFQQIHSDYDDDSLKVSKVLEIMKNEWTKAIEHLENAIVANNRDEIQRVIHKMANVFRTLNLPDLEREIKDQLIPSDSDAPSINPQQNWVELKKILLGYRNQIHLHLAEIQKV
ncbi:MAG: HAMP domain-containing protein [Saprospiraceae bacterium]|nr:HAMP domain-containing protein [Saprospiraceae bacterium]